MRRYFDEKERILSLPFDYVYDRKTGVDKIVLNNGEKINLTNASSGIQSLVPLVMTINFLTDDFFRKEKKSVEKERLYIQLLEKISLPENPENLLSKYATTFLLFYPQFTSFFIEEPEAHIFPSTQKDFVYTLVEKLNNERQHTCFIATHSPYIMTAINNLMLAPTISVIVPVYNTEHFLPKCLDSLLGQTLSDIEIICVDDCSDNEEMIDLLEEINN